MRVRATLRLRNNDMIEARAAVGLSQANLGQLVGLGQSEISQVERFEYDSPRVLAKRQEIADALGLDAEQVMPQEMVGTRIPHTFMRVATMTPRQFANASVSALRAPPAPSDQLEREELAAKIDEAMNLLTCREREVLKHRFGLNGNRTERTLEDVGRMFKVTREVIRQVEARAIRKLRLPMRAELIEQAI